MAEGPRTLSRKPPPVRRSQRVCLRHQTLRPRRSRSAAIHRRLSTRAWRISQVFIVTTGTSAGARDPCSEVHALGCSDPTDHRQPRQSRSYVCRGPGRSLVLNRRNDVHGPTSQSFAARDVSVIRAAVIHLVPVDRSWPRRSSCGFGVVVPLLVLPIAVVNPDVLVRAGKNMFL